MFHRGGLSKVSQTAKVSYFSLLTFIKILLIKYKKILTHCGGNAPNLPHIHIEYPHSIAIQATTSQLG
jgi:hypothetical protein